MWTPVAASEAEGIKGRFADFMAEDQLEAAFIEPSFYTSAAILHMRAGESVQRFIAVGDGNISSRDFYPLTGESIQIHAANERAGFKLENPADAESYLRFFCEHIVTEEGEMFHIIDRFDGLLSTGQFDTPVAPPVFIGIGQEEMGPAYIFDVFMIYEGQLFAAEMAVYTDGKVEMTHDFPLGIVVHPTIH